MDVCVDDRTSSMTVLAIRHLYRHDMEIGMPHAALRGQFIGQATHR